MVQPVTKHLTEVKNNMQATEKLTAVDGIKAAVPIAIGFIPIALAYGILAKASDVPNIICALMSLLVYAGASQFMAVNLMSLGVMGGEIVMTTFILNLRHLLMSASLAQRIEKNVSAKMRSLIAFGVTDETFSVASFRQEKTLSPAFLLGLNFTAFAAWNIGTWLGIFLASGLPESVKACMGIALYAMFIGLLIPSLKTSKPFLIVAIIAAATHALLNWLPLFAALSTGWTVIISTLIAAALGAALFPKEGANNG